MKTRAASADQVRISIDLYSNSIIPLLAPTTDLTAAATAAGNIDFASGLGQGGTLTDNALTQLSAKIGSSGSGYTPNSRKSYVVLITDGIQNSLITTTPVSGGAFTGTHDPNYDSYTFNSPSYTWDSMETLTTIDHTLCDPIKSAGHTLLTGRVDYLIPTPDNGGTDDRFFAIENLKSFSATEFKACASDPSLDFIAKTPADITLMYKNILDNILLTSNIALTR